MLIYLFLKFCPCHLDCPEIIGMNREWDNHLTYNLQTRHCSTSLKNLWSHTLGPSEIMLSVADSVAVGGHIQYSPSLLWINSKDY